MLNNISSKFISFWSPDGWDWLLFCSSLDGDIFADFNKELSNDYKINTNFPVKNNNNNFYSNVHIKAITNIKELISNNLNNTNTNSSNNNNNSSACNLKNSNSLTFQNNLSFDNSNNELDQSKKSILKTALIKNIYENEIFFKDEWDNLLEMMFSSPEKYTQGQEHLFGIMNFYNYM